MKNILVILLFCFAGNLNSQVHNIEGVVKDLNGKQSPIPDVNIYTSSNPKSKTKSSSNGTYKIQIDVKEGNDTIFFHHVGFESTYKIFYQKQYNKQIKSGHYTLKANISLNYKTLDDFSITAKKVDTVFGSPKVSVEDFLLLNDNRLLLLTYEKQLRKGAQIILTDSEQKPISEKIIPGNALYLYQDYAGSHFVVCEHKVFQINIVRDEIRFYDISLDDFYGFNFRVIDTIQDRYYYSNFNELYPAVKFIVTQITDSTHHELLEVKDDFMMELYRAQYKYVSGRDKLWAYRKEQETGIDKEVWIGAASFTQDILYKPVYAPLFIVRDTVLVFDQYKSLLFKFDANNQLLDSVNINYYIKKNKEKWEQPLLKDPVQSEIFALYNKGGYNYLKNIDIQNGLTSMGFKLSNRFVEQVKIYNGYAYYIYRPYESLQKKFLYKEEIIIK